MIETLQSLPIFFKYIVTAIIGMTPVIEIRGAIPIGVATFNLSYLEAFIASFIEYNSIYLSDKIVGIFIIAYY